MTTRLTPEQQRVIHHPRGNHARVLAVAGSGKTETMAHRIKHLVMNEGVSANSIRVLMFNREARLDFQKRLGEIDIPKPRRPNVYTFHALAHRFIEEMVKSGVIPRPEIYWINDKEELVWITLHQAIRNLVKREKIPSDSVDPDDAAQAISLWKNSLIPPERAGYGNNEHLPLVYAEYESLRNQKRAITFDDFVPLAIQILETKKQVYQTWGNRLDHLIVDEYQDVNYGQQRFVELLAGQRADVMVVGDDDQTIYEWRGARPEYIIREFQNTFDNKPHAIYNLSRSFRFGPLIAQCAYNTITFNTTRVQKQLIAHRADLPAQISIIGQGDANRTLAEQIFTMVTNHKIPPAQIIVLVRMYAQAAGIEAEFLAHHIPYRVEGQSPFYKRREITALLNYIEVALALEKPVTMERKEWLLSIANTPSRKLGRQELTKVFEAARLRQATISQAIEMLTDSSSSFNQLQIQAVNELEAFLKRLRERIDTESELTAGALLKWMVDQLDYLKHFDNYYGEGEASFDRKSAVLYFLIYATRVNLPASEFLDHINELDITRGAPEDQQIVITSIFKTKGLQFDYVIIPNCVEGFLPCHYNTENLIFDKARKVREPEPSEVIENERRLFYVALTRAKKMVFIGTDGQTSQNNSLTGSSSRFLEEIEFEPTAAIMEATQQLAAGNHQAQTTLLEAIEQYGGYKKVTANLLAGYLQDIGNKALLGQIAGLVATKSEVPFVYKSAYPARKKSTPTLHEAWGEAWF